ncbi:MAG: RsmD family RNA methyltransferase [Bacteroidetes bacterium]|nr:RsmD family RNA methyltransferase [Bacteroidota bacterium]
MRVISGKYKGKRFDPPRNFPSRPTTDFAKEALFNILENRYDFDGLQILDLFAGTGSISLEFISRDAGQVTSVDNHAVSCKFLQSMKTSVNAANWQIIKQDAMRFLEETQATFDLIFADPPFAMPGQAEIPRLVFERGLLNSNGLLIVEHGRENNFEKIPRFTEIRNYGGVCFSFFDPDSDGD